MATYGKKKKSILPSFTSLRDLNSSSCSTSKSTKDKIKPRGSAIPVSTLPQTTAQSQTHYHHDDSIEEMASMLLDDTDMDQLRTDREPGKRLSQIATAKALSGLSLVSSPDSKALPQLPQLLFNGDDVWAMRTTPVVTAAGSNNEVHFSMNDTSVPENQMSQFSEESRKGDPPPIPRRSSKRKSARPLSSTTTRAELDVNAQTSAENANAFGTTVLATPNPRPPPRSSTLDTGKDVNKQIQLMMAATEALKPGSSNSTMLQGPYVKKRRLKDNKILTKVKTAINDRLQARNSKKKHDPVKDDYLLDNSSINEYQTPDDIAAPSPTVSSVERRLNEGDNLKKYKVHSLTGHGHIRRKQVAEDGKSLRSRKSISDDPFSERPGSSGITRTPTRFENRLHDDMSFDHLNEPIPDLPNQAHSIEDLPRPRSKKATQSAYDADFDAVFSSSPVAQSTPRIRLEPTFEEDGKTILKHVCADSRSMFDADNLSVGHYSDMEIDIPPQGRGRDGRENDTKRKSSQAKDFRLAPTSRDPKRIKKHPSPSKTELEHLERALSELPVPNLGLSESANNLDDMAIDTEPWPLSNVLSLKDANAKLTNPNGRYRSRGFGITLKPDLTRTTVTMSDIYTRGKGQALSMIPKPGESSSARPRLEARGERRFSTREESDGDLMDIDELQWDQTALMRSL